MSKNILGIDIGEKGCLAVMTNGQIQEIRKMPWGVTSNRNAIDSEEFNLLLGEMIDEYNIDLISTEIASSHLPTQGTAASMWFSYGMMVAVIKRIKIKLLETPAKKWQGEFGFLGKKAYEKLIGRKMRKGEKHTKPQSIAVCEALFPSLSLRFDGQKKTTKNDNIADAVLIAEYARRKDL